VLDNIIVLNISIAAKILQMQRERERVTSFLNLCRKDFLHAFISKRNFGANIVKILKVRPF
jgi:hypothetical protein